MLFRTFSASGGRPADELMPNARERADSHHAEMSNAVPQISKTLAEHHGLAIEGRSCAPKQKILIEQRNGRGIAQPVSALGARVVEIVCF